MAQPGLAFVLAVAEATALREREHVREGRVETALVLEEAELARPGVSISTPPPFELDELATRRGVAAPVIAAQPANGLHVAADQPIRERRLADTRRADEADRAARCDVRAQLVEPFARHGAHAHEGDVDRRAADRFEQRREIRIEVPLCSARPPAWRRVPDRAHVALEPPLVEVAVHGRHDEEHVDVHRDELAFRLGARGATDQRGSPVEDVLDRRAVGTVDDRDPVADDRALEFCPAFS